MSRVAVIGSGPASAACIRGLLARGADVTVLDVGERLDSATQAVVDRLRTSPQSEWSGDDVALVTREGKYRRDSIPFKLAFGSDYVYGAKRDYSVQTGTGAIPTYALGGYSTVWGGAMLPMADSDLAGWPLASERLAPHYRAMRKHLPLVADAGDALSTVFPEYGPVSRLALPSQGASLVADLKASQRRLESEGVLAGRARLAVHSASGDHAGCIHCGLCLSGCPVGAIYSSADDIEAWIREGRIAYRDGAVVLSLQESDSQVQVAFKTPDGTQRGSESFDQVFVAAGPVSTTRILLNSLGLRDRTVTLLDSQKFLVPLLRRKSDPEAVRARGNVLASAFVEMLDRSVSDHWVHVQVSPMNNLLLGRVGKFGTQLLAPLLARSMVAWGSLHSDDSGRIEVALRGPGEGELSVRARAMPRTRTVVTRAVAKLQTVARTIHSIVLPIALRVGVIGRSAHVGGSFPMSGEAGTFRSDLVGRPSGLKRVYLADSSTFPTIPATTIAFTIMANAHRIATEAVLD